MTDSALTMSSRYQDGIPKHLAALEDKIAELASSIAAACWRLLDAVRQFDEQEGWVQYGCLSCEQRRSDALVTMAEGFLQGKADAAGDQALHQVVVHVDAEMQQDASADGRSETEAPAFVTADTSRRLSCAADVVMMHHDGKGGVLDVGRRTRGVSRAFKRALLERDGGCQFPSCTHRYIDAHHVRHSTQGGETKLSNLASLCRRHHRFVHEGGYSMAQGGDGQVTFLRPDAQPLQRAWLPTPVAKLRPLQQWVPRLHLDAQTAYAQWDGEPVDYD